MVRTSVLSGRAAVYDCLFLTAVVVLSCLPYLSGLGMYSDDWGILPELDHVSGSFRGMWDVLVPMGIDTRPVQGLVLAGLFMLFELDPLGYHVVNAAVLVGGTLLFYLSLRALGLARVVAVAVPLIFGLLPHYSTDRFWIAAFQANVSVFLYFLSLYADLRFLAGTMATRWLWKALGVTAMVGSVLAYELTGLLFLVNVLVLWYVAGARPPRVWTPRRVRALAVASNVLFLALAIGYKLSTTVRADVAATAGYRYRALRILTEAVPVHFGELGFGLPLRVARVLSDYADPAGIAVSLLVGLIVGAYLLKMVRPSDPSLDSRVGWPRVMLVGALLFCAGYGVTLMTWEIGFHSTGMNNRTAMGAAIGVAWVFAGAIGGVSRLLPTDRLRWITFATLTALLTAGNTLVINAVAAFWVRASHEQQAVIASVRQRLPTLPAGTTLLLDGLCPFVGPAPVFATDWDARGMLWVAYDDRSILGDVVKPNTELTPDGIRTQFFDDWIHVYPYGRQLTVYHLETGDVVVLPSRAAAQQYFEDVSIPSRPPCAPYSDGDGVAIF